MQGLFAAAPDRSQMKKIFRENINYKQILLDCKDLTFMDTAGLGILVEARKDLQKKKTDLVLCELSQFLMELFEKSNLLQLVPYFPDRKTALNNLGN
jgi:anti-anti-sigma factor